MADWQHKLYLGDLKNMYENDKITLETLTTEIVLRIRKADFYERYKKELEPMCKQFLKIKTERGFDSALSKLYDWGDISLFNQQSEIQRRMCWIDFL